MAVLMSFQQGEAVQKCWPKISLFTDEEVEAYFLTDDHPARLVLNTLFKNPTTLQDDESFVKSGFKILHKRPSTLIVASHPSLKGYLIKLHLDNSTRIPYQMWRNFFRRCRGATYVRDFIKENNIEHFIVPDKFIYLPPRADALPILLVTDMNTVTKTESTQFWKAQVTKEQIDELFNIVSHGLASTSLAGNLPLTKDNKIALVDTECPKRIPHYDHVARHLGSMKAYWNQLVETHVNQY